MSAGSRHQHSFSVIGEKSKDDGKTWVGTMDIEYMRAQQ
jgi:hypothetical protein